MVSFGLSLPLTAKIDYLINLAVDAESAGFEYVLMPDHIISLDNREPLNVWDVLCILSVKTRNIKLGSLVANIYRQHPTTLKQHVSTLNRVSDGRAILGIGAGTVFDMEPYGIRQENPILHMQKTIEVIREGVKNVPIIVGARGLKMKKLAGTLADGWVSRHALSFSQFMQEMKEVKQWVRNDKFMYVADIPVSFLDDPWLWRSLAYRYLLQTDFWGMTFTEEVKKNIEIASSNVSRLTLESFSAVGDEEKIVGILEPYVKNGVNVFSIRLYGNSFERFSKVIDYFKG